jgi:amino acid transporter
MNIVRGMDRVSWVIAIIAIIPIFVLSVGIFMDIWKNENPAYLAWENKKKNRPFYTITDLSEQPPDRYIWPSISKVVLPASATTIAGFFMVLFGIRWATFGIRWATHGIRVITLWVYKGFKDD